MKIPYIFLYIYYHTDHLGSATLVTDDAADVVQQIAYLPYGEEWVNIRHRFGSSHKFNGKQKDDETGYSYYGARYYTDRLSIWLSVDPLADKYPHLSPYAYCADNPVKYIDPDGMKIVGTDGKPVTFSPDKGWSSNAPKDVIKVGNAMMRTKTGTKVLNDMFNAKYDISISIQQEGRNGNIAGKTTTTYDPKAKKKTIKSKDIVIYNELLIKMSEEYNDLCGREESDIRNYENLPDIEKMYIKLGPTVEDMYTTIGTHEGVHASDKQGMSGFNEKAEEYTINIEKQAVKELINKSEIEK